MDRTNQSRAMMTGMGALAALALYLWVHIGQAEVLVGRPLLFGVVATGVFFSALLSVAPRIPLARATLFAAVLGIALGLLAVLVSRRYDGLGAVIDAAHPMFALLILTALPLPFFIAHARGNWRDYAMLFEQAWGIALRFVIGFVLVGVVWLLIILSDLLLSLVGLGFLEMIWDFGPAAYLITGAAGGFGKAVAAESMGVSGARLALILLRPLLPLLVAVVAIFLMATPFQGLSSLFGTLSAGMTLMAISAVAATLVTAVVDARGEAASRSKLLALSARIMSGLMLILGALAVVAVAQRVQQYGWTPARIYAALAAGVSLGYGICYAAGAARADWMARIRRANVTMALALIALAALTLTPVLNAERISTNSQMARFSDGRTPPERLDILAFERWGIAGNSALDALTLLSKQAGREALAQRLANQYLATGDLAATAATLRRDLAARIPLTPSGTRIDVQAQIATLDDYLISQIAEACATPLPNGQPACVLIVADFLPDVAGDEGMISWLDSNETMNFQPLLAERAALAWTFVQNGGQGAPPSGEVARTLISLWQVDTPRLTPAPINQLRWDAGSVIMLP